ncbi:MAG: hypothetical protein R3C19_15715 [Planctomycetaceae bacterium]
MRIILPLIAITAISTVTSPAVVAGFDFLGCRKPDCCSRGCGAPACMLVCRPECKTVKEKHTCFDVESEYVCIPPVQLPKCGSCLGKLCGFDACDSDCHTPACGGCGLSECSECAGIQCNTCPTANCQPNCGNGFLSRMKNKLCGCRVRRVSKLKAVSSEKEKQVVEWTVETCQLPTCKSCGGTGPCFGCGPCGE